MIADEIRAFLARHPMSQAELARSLEPDDPRFRDTLNRWLNGHQEPRHPGTVRLALEALDRRLSEPCTANGSRMALAGPSDQEGP